jgi:hypothetical protein
VLRWALQLGQVVIPRSANPDHIPANLQVRGGVMRAVGVLLDRLLVLALHDMIGAVAVAKVPLWRSLV